MGITNIVGIIAFLIKNWSILQQLFTELRALLNGSSSSATTPAHSILEDIIAALEGKSAGGVLIPTPINQNAPGLPPVPQSPIKRGGLLGGILGGLLRRRK